ncbi:MAG TPA: DUF2341 domain-containing protein [Candidatus Saccharimonadales bacterium]|nr:DUF2341 domain-containing protein [Candidatus Saccharimonadales bacterium]
MTAIHAGALSNPAVDSYNVRAGTETFAGLYKFTTNTLLVETAEAITNMGSDVIKFYMGANTSGQSGVTLGSQVTNLLTLARDEPSYHRVLDMPFRHLIIWSYPLANADSWWANGYNTAHGANDYREMYDLTCYLLTNYNNSGKTFYLGHWEGDGYLSVVVNGQSWATNPPAITIQRMIGWLNNRQQAVDDARRNTPHTNVFVFNYAEANRVRDAMNNGPTNNERVINMVVPYVTNLDYLSYSSYDSQNLAASDLYATLDYMQGKLSTNKAAAIPGERIFVGEYGWGYLSAAAQEPLSRAYIQRLLGWSSAGECLPHILFWEIYNNQAPSTGATNFYLIDPSGNKAPCYYLHQYYINDARLLVAQFIESTGALPSDTQFSTLVSPMLNAPLLAPVNLTLTNLSASLVSGTTALVSATLAQGVYGDDEATVSVFWGLQNGGTNPGAWQDGKIIGVNTNFNPAVFTAVLTNLAPASNYYIAFYASNVNAQAWASTAGPLNTAGVASTNYTCRMKISFPGYSGSEILANFPALVQFSNGLSGFSYGQFASPAGGDLRFTDAGGLTLLPYEIDQWNLNGVSSVWVQLPVLSGTNTSIWAYWGNPAATNPPASTTNGAVWLPQYQLVWHSEQSGLPYEDSAGQHPGLSGVPPGLTAGAIGSGGFFNGASSYLHAGTVNVGNTFTLFAWAKMAVAASNIQTIWANKPAGWNTDGFGLYVNTYNTSDQRLLFEDGDGVTGITLSSASGAVTPGVWHCLAAAVNKTIGSAQLYLDGASVAEGSAVTDFANASGLDFGRFTNSYYYFNGSLDEARIATGICSSNWIWATWLNVASNLAFTASSAVNPSPSLSYTNSSAGPVLTWPSAAGVFAVYTTTNLALPAIWLPATNAVAYINGQWQSPVLPPANGAQFYRLQAR